MNSVRIVVVGAGLGGLACARGLQLHGRSVTVYEREESASTRWQGGLLDLHAPTGQAALQTLGLLDRFRAAIRPEAQELRVLDPVTAAVLHHEEPAEAAGFAPEIDRGVLRALLLDSLEPGTVHWGHPVDGVTALDDGTARVHFADGTTETADLVVGADGAWSRTRAAVSAAVPTYTGTTLLETVLDDVDTRHPALAELVGPGSLVAGGGATMLGAQRSGGHVRVYVDLDGVPMDWHGAAGVDLADAEAVRAHLLARLDGWHDSLRELVRRGDGGFVNRPIQVLAPGHRWEHVPGITLLGDAAHLLPPHGIGANLALLDASDLATAVATNADLAAAVRAYENVMLPRAAAAAAADTELSAIMDDEQNRDIGTARRLLNERILNPAD